MIIHARSARDSLTPERVFMGFVHLHVHSQFSLLDGTLKPGQIADLAAKHGMTSVAMTDTVNLFGAVAFYKACKKAGVRPILGAEIHVQPEGVKYEDPRGQVLLEVR